MKSRSLIILTACFTVICLTGLSRAHESEDHAFEGPTHFVKLDPNAAPAKTGSGDYVYETVPGWMKLPEGKAIGNTHGQMVVDKVGNLYITSDGQYSVLVYSPDGKYLRSFDKSLARVHGMQLVEEDGIEYIYVAHLGAKRIAKLKTDGSEVWSRGYPKDSGKYQDGKKYSPTGIAVAPDGRIYVVDGYGLQWVHVYDKEGNYTKSFGGRGKEPGKFNTCHGIAIDSRSGTPLLLISDRENRRLQHFDLDGNFKAVITEGLRRPCSVSIHGDHVAIAELQARVTILDKDNKQVAHLGDNPNKGHWANNGVPPDQWTDGIFTAPHGVCYDKDGNLFVMDWNRHGRITKLVKATN